MLEQVNLGWILASRLSVQYTSWCRHRNGRPFSTGVIGEPLPVQLICDALPRAMSASEGLRSRGIERRVQL